MPNKQIEPNYLADLTLSDARIWFRNRSQILDNIKGNRSSQWENRMHCRHCTTGLRETQDHLEECTFFRKYRDTLDLTKGEHKLIFWRRVTLVLKDLKIAIKDVFDHTVDVIKHDQINDVKQSETVPASRGKLHRSLSVKPAPEVVSVFGSTPVWLLAPKRWVSVRWSRIIHRSKNVQSWILKFKKRWVKFFKNEQIILNLYSYY